MEKAQKWMFLRGKNKETRPISMSLPIPMGMYTPKVYKDEDIQKNVKLMELCKNGNMDSIRAYCSENTALICSSVNLPIDVAGNVALHLTVSQNDYIITAILLLKGADPNIANRSGIMPINIAFQMGYQKLIDLLLKFGAIPTVLNESKSIRQKSIIEASENHVSLNSTQGLFGSFSSQKTSKAAPVEVLDEEARDLVQMSLETGIMILPDSAYLGLKEPLLSVLKKETMEDIDDEGATILMKASYRGHLEIVKELLNLGADTDAIDKSGNTAMVWAVVGGKSRIVKVLHDAGGSIEGAVLHSKKLDLFIKGQMTPLIAASYYGHNSIVKYLIQEKCEINLRVGPGKGKSAIMVAAWARRKETVKILLENAAHVDPDVDVWLSKGIIQLKKIALEKNAWFHTGVESMPSRRDQNSNSNLNTISSGSQLRRASLQDKFVYFTADENDVVSEITNLLVHRAGVSVQSTTPTSSSNETNVASPTRTNSLQRASQNRKRNLGNRQAINFHKIFGSNSDVFSLLTDQIPNEGTELDELWIGLVQCVVQLIMAANKNIKHQYVPISAKAVHYSAEIVRSIEAAEKDKKVMIQGVRFEPFCETEVRRKVRDFCSSITTELPKQLMLSTRMAIGVWPSPDSVSEMIKNAANLASKCRDAVLVGNTFGCYPLLDKKFEVTFQPFEQTVSAEEESAPQEKDSSLTGGLSYSEYKRQNDLKMIEKMAKTYENVESENFDECNKDEKLEAEFFAKLDDLMKQFAASVTELKSIHDQHLLEDFIKATSSVHEKLDNIMQEILGFELLKFFSDNIEFEPADLQKLEENGIKFNFPTSSVISVRALLHEMIEETKSAGLLVMARGKIASIQSNPTSAGVEMLQSIRPCVLAIKKLVHVAKASTTKVRIVGSDERRKQEALDKERRENEHTKLAFQMWEKQMLNSNIPGMKRNANELGPAELKLLEDSSEGVVYDKNNKVKGGRLGKLVEVLTSHQVQTDDEFIPAFFLTLHSFTTSVELLEALFKRYDIRPPFGLDQREYEIYMDKKVVQVRLKVCHVLLHWIKTHFEEDFVDNQHLILRFKDFITKKVIMDFDKMAEQILDALEQQLLLHDHGNVVNSIFDIEKIDKEKAPKPILSTTRFGTDPITNLLQDKRAFLEIDPLEMARQLTLIEHGLYCKVKAYECLDQIWENRIKKEQSKHPKNPQNKRHEPGSLNSDISKLIQHTNDFTFWVATCIINNEALKTRFQALKYFIQLAQHCKELNNLTGVTTIIAALTMGPVNRLHKTWAMVDEKFPKLMETFKDLQSTISSKFQFSNYRKYLREAELPAIPFLGVFLTDLTFLDVGNSDFLPDTHFINFDKRRKVYYLIQEVQKYQNVGYNLIPLPQIHDFMKRISESRSLQSEEGFILTEDELYTKSLQYEPKEAEDVDS